MMLCYHRVPNSDAWAWHWQCQSCRHEAMTDTPINVI